MTKLWLTLVTAVAGLATWVVKLVSTKADPKQRKEKERMDLAVEFNKLVRRKQILDEKIRTSKNFMRRKLLQTRLLDVLNDISELRKTIQASNRWG